MAAVRVLFCLLCFAFAGRSGLFDRSVVEDGRAVKRDAAAVVRAAQKEIGIREAGENAGAKVDEYNAYVGLHKVAWCASFVSWCYGQAGYKKPRTAWSQALFPTGRLAKEPAAGMILGIYFPDMGRIAHCGIVEKVRNNLVYSIEGNTNINGSREGDGVYRRIRHKRTIHSYSNWANNRLIN